MTAQLSGAFAPVPTPLNAQDAVDAGAIRAHLAWLAQQGLTGALILGTNGEFASLSMAERKAAAYAAARGGRPKMKLMLGVGSCALPDALDMVKLAKEYDYDAALCAPPFYFRQATVQGLAEFFKRVLDAAKVPVLLYHIPQFTGVAISDELIAAIGAHENLAGVKDSTGDEAELARLVKTFAGKLYLIGNDKLVAAAYAAGAAGSITATASVVPDLVEGVRKTPALQAKLNSVRSILEKFGLGPAVKAILRKKGFGLYASRPPLASLDPAAEKQLIAMLDMFGVVKW
ncbi:MAG: dihydrodipicolinate synthase family protein [Planctomycetes bacterium]|nr:dihydrodipicolinate synthase family protein [Planctomycetota bacterium]